MTVYEKAVEVISIMEDRETLMKQLKETETSKVIQRAILKEPSISGVFAAVQTDIEDDLGYLHNRLLDLFGEM